MTQDEKKGIFLPVLVLVLSIAMFFVSYQYLMPSVVENMAKSKALDSDISLAQTKITSISTADKTMTRLTDLINSLFIAVPDSVDTPNLITEIESIATANSVLVSGITPPVDSKTTAKTSTSTSGLTVNISLTGTFQNIEGFINSLENSIRFSKINSLVITASKDNNLAASLSFEVYKRASTTTTSTTTGAK